ncbi:hypothetical protein BD311DRAFT_12088 [Dichomitus squalens]|uniref:Uncharacterized protein n=1 Tax=Dichomitus squalens TaxID=114155 RepID=A0A4Q9N502_9APHY|nr:hypothetical protein BD311DRAFT_12088 [Dichomitus squalens]
MDPATPANVAKGAAITSIVSGTFTAVHALYRGSSHPTPLALSAAVNGGIAGTLFFSIREAAIRPLLRRSGHSAHTTPDTSSQPSWSHLRMHDVPETIISSALTGGIINAWRRGSAGIWAGARTAAVICTVLQFGFNELSVMRVKFVSRQMQESQPRPEIVPSPPDTLEEPRTSIFDRLMAVIGFRKLTDEEYMKALKKQRDAALERIAVLEHERREKERSEADGAT